MSSEQEISVAGAFVRCEDQLLESSNPSNAELSKIESDPNIQRLSGKSSTLSLVSSKRCNTSPHIGQVVEVGSPATTLSSFLTLLQKLQPQNKVEQQGSENLDQSAELLDPLLSRLAEQQSAMDNQRNLLHKYKDSVRSRGGNIPAEIKTDLPSPDPVTAALEASSSISPLTPLSDISSALTGKSVELYGYKPLSSLGEISRQTQSMQNRHHTLNSEFQQRTAKRTIEQSSGHSSFGNFTSGQEITEQTISCLQNALNNAPRSAPLSRTEAWPFEDNMDLGSESGEPLSAGSSYTRHNNIWTTGSKATLPSLPVSSPTDYAPLSRSNSIEHDNYFGPNRSGWGNNRRTFSTQPGLNCPPLSGEQRGYGRRPSFASGNSAFGRSNFEFAVPATHLPSPTTASYTPSPIGTPLSPTATEFTTSSSGSAVWGSHNQANNQQTYVSTIEPLNYRRLLERSVNCNWKYIVDKIVCNNDQQASIFLQQKLKIGTPDQKHAIVEAIVAQAYPLMVNRFGNFLVQRCFEHGTPEQIDGIANAVRGNTLALSMDAFGCHVIQKAFDCVSESFKVIMVSELLRRIPETVVHRYACHVWQKLFELRWTDSPPQIMKYVNEALRGRWHEVALGETGSLVVQNIFENCLEEDKRPCINEVLANIDLIAHGQFGNWCIQHICEHGAPPDRSKAIDVVIRNAPEYSMDQYASKVVEKCLKIGGSEFLDRYLDRVCEGRPDRPRIPLIDIASDQYGNYLVQWVLQHASPAHREQVASHIRKHMVSLRGSKFGSRVGMLCCNPVYTRMSSSGNAGGASNSSTSSRFSRYGYR